MLDCECVATIDGTTYSFSRPWEVGVAVACVYEHRPPEGAPRFRDIIGGLVKPFDAGVADIQRLADHLETFGIVVGFNTCAWDYRTIDPYLERPEGVIAAPQITSEPPRYVEEHLKGRTIDMLADIYEQHGKRVSLASLMEGTLGQTKTNDSALVPERWRAGDRGGVIADCREHVQATWAIYDLGKEDGFVTSAYKGRNTEIPVRWTLR